MRKVLTTLLLCGVLTACTPGANPTVSIDPQADPSPAVSLPTSTLTLARQRIATNLQAGRHQEALAIIDKERTNSGSPRLLEEEQLQTLKSLSAVGEKFFLAGDYERSGRSLRLLLNHFPQERTTARQLGLSRQDLQARLELCAERLMAQGLIKYRAGDLPAAIETWKKILAFHGAHEGAKKGLRTAEIQLQNLRALP
jgi:tetratricopeptide (TPR) repeat protein